MERPLDELDLPTLNLLTLRQRFYTQAAARAAETIEHRSPKTLQHLLESHLVRMPTAAGVRERQDLDDLLRYYSMLELASMVGAIPRALPEDISTSARLHLDNRFVKTYYEGYYPLLLPRLFLARIDGQPAPSDLDETNNAEFLMQFIDISSMCETAAVRAFLRLLDDHTAAAAPDRKHGLGAVLGTLHTGDRLARYLATPAERQTPEQRALDGLSDFMRFARALNRYLTDVSDHAVWQSACWHYHGVWFQQLAGRVVGAITAAIELYREHVPGSVEEIRGDLRALELTVGAPLTDGVEPVAEAISTTHASMDETLQALRMLTSGIYRAALDAYALSATRPREEKPTSRFGVSVPRASRLEPERTPPLRIGGTAIGALAFEAVASAKMVDADRVFAALEEALATAARKYYKTREPIHVLLNRGDGSIEMWVEKEVVGGEGEIDDPDAQWTLEQARSVDAGAQFGDTIKLDYLTKNVVDVLRDPHTEIRTSEAEKIDPEVMAGDTLHIPLMKAAEDFARFAAQSAKQVLYQKVREAEREKVYNEFKDKVGELENGYVKRFERGDMIIDLNGKAEGIIPRSQQSRAERYSQGDQIKAVIVDVHTQPKGPQVVLSRTDPRLLIKLFEMEVPEIYNGTVVIKGAVREPGERAKIAVMSRERNVDPVGACVGMKSSRLQSIIRELRGEKIDIIPWHDNIVTYAQNALAPAKIHRVSVTRDESAHRPHLDVVVEKDQLPQAIGKLGVNVRLAAELIGAKINIKTREEVQSEVADALTAMLQEAMAETRAATNVHDIENMPAGWADRLEEAGYDDLDSILNASVEDLTAINGVDEQMAARILDLASNHEFEKEEVEEYADPDEDDAESVEQEAEKEEIENG